MDWRHNAACRDVDPELFFPIGNTGPALLQIDEAKRVCRRCSGDGLVPAAGRSIWPGRRRLGRHERGRAARPQAAHAAAPRPRATYRLMPRLTSAPSDSS